jgi:hypothetical protein
MLSLCPSTKIRIFFSATLGIRIFFLEKKPYIVIASLAIYVTKDFLSNIPGLKKIVVH